MYLHVGRGTIIKKDKIIGIFDLDTATVSATTKTMLRHMEQKGQVVYKDSDLPRSFVLCTDKKGNRHIQLSRISAQGLLGRATKDLSDTKDT